MMDELNPKLTEILRRADSLLGSIESTFDGEHVFTVEEMLRRANHEEEEREKRVKINNIINDLKDVYHLLPSTQREGNGQILVTDTQAYGYLTLIPTRGGGRSIQLPDVMAIIQAHGITHGLNYMVVEAAVDTFAKGGGLVYSLKIAECSFPEKGAESSIVYRVPYLHKRELFDQRQMFKGKLTDLVTHVDAGTVVARIHPALEGVDGTSVRGEFIPSSRGNELSIQIGDNLQQAITGNDISASAQGVVVLDRNILSVVPFYIVEGDLDPHQDINFNGNVLITGNVHGPVTITCEDCYIQGNAEAASLFASGDISVGGGVIGKKLTVIEADGYVFARFISDATIRAMNDIVVRSSLTYSDVTTNGQVNVTSDRGSIIGGSVSALKGIVAKSIGSDFGTFTSTTVGKDYLSADRLLAIERHIKEHEANLAKMDMLKRRLAEAKIDVSQMESEKQDKFISIMKKEEMLRGELASLKRGRDRFNQAMEHFMDASIEILDNLHPPVRVQIGEVIKEIRERMQKVVLVLDRDNTIMTKTEEVAS